LSPDTVECLAGSLDGNVDILWASLVNGADWLLVGRVESLEGLALLTLDPLSIDEQTGGCSYVMEGVSIFCVKLMIAVLYESDVCTN